MQKVFKSYLMPGLVFESVVIGGGYATGRELVEFFLRYGPLGGLFGMLVTLLVWSCVLAVMFEYSRIAQAYDYRTFFRHLLGPCWVVFDALYVVMMLLVLSVIGAACGAIFEDSLGLSSSFGVASLAVLVCLFVYFGSSLVERALSLWAILLYFVYGILVVWCIAHFSRTISANLLHGPVLPTWLLGGVAYAGYNLATAPSVLFTLRHVTTRPQAICAGLFGGLLAIVPGIFFYFSVLAFYPSIQSAPVPSVYILQHLHAPVFTIFFEVALFGTLVKTSIGLLHALNERLAAAWVTSGRPMPAIVRPLASLLALALATVVADKFGIIALIAKGYGTMTYLFMLVFILPLMTVGLRRIIVWRATPCRLDGC